jgi:hypothetical protein
MMMAVKKNYDYYRAKLAESANMREHLQQRLTLTLLLDKCRLWQPRKPQTDKSLIEKVCDQ